MKEHEDTILALIAGYVDTLGFVALFGLFTAHVTGNFVLIGAEVAGVGQGALLKLLAFPAFIAGIALSSVLFKFLERDHSAHAASALYVFQAVLARFVFGDWLRGRADHGFDRIDGVGCVACWAQRRWACRTRAASCCARPDCRTR